MQKMANLLFGQIPPVTEFSELFCRILPLFLRKQLLTLLSSKVSQLGNFEHQLAQEAMLEPLYPEMPFSKVPLPTEVMPSRTKQPSWTRPINGIC